MMRWGARRKTPDALAGSFVGSDDTAKQSRAESPKARRLGHLDNGEGNPRPKFCDATAALNFVIIAFVLFLAIKGMNKLKKEEPCKSLSLAASLRSGR
ncbi:hypothetical protein SAMN05216338_103835 [Bradyrhizobium sp. Rc2d]|nr:hypothetical protein SAMN05216338_103835 [Bradyrhizobium sp. Rc2d]